MNAILSTILPYLFKGGLLSLATYFFGDLRSFVKSAMWQSIIQAVIFAFILFLLDRFLPSAPTIPAITDGVEPSANAGILDRLTAGLTGSQPNVLNNLYGLLQGAQQGPVGPMVPVGRQAGGNCGISYDRQVGGECGLSSYDRQVGGECGISYDRQVGGDCGCGAALK